MDRLTTEKRVEIFKIYYTNRGSNVATFRALGRDCGRYYRPTVQGIGNFIDVCIIVMSALPKILRLLVKVWWIIRICRLQWVLSNWVYITALWRILHFNLHLHPYKVQLTLQLKSAEHSRRPRYAGSNKIFFSVEAHFLLGLEVSLGRIFKKMNAHDEKIITDKFFEETILECENGHARKRNLLNLVYLNRRLSSARRRVC